MAGRTPIPQFELSNPLYKGATISFWLVANGVKSSVLADLYAAPTGLAKLPNPQKLNSQGRSKQPIYIQDQVIGTIEGISVPTHDTSIFNPIPVFRITSSGHLEYSFDAGATYTDAGFLSPTDAQSSFITFLHSGGGAFLETVSDVLNRECWIESFMSDAMKASVAAEDLAVNCMPAFVDAAQSFPTDLDYPAYSIGGRVNIGRGKFRLTPPWQLNRNIHWRGLTGPMRNSFGASQLWFDDNNQDAMVAEWYQNDSSAHMAVGMRLENLYLKCNRVAGTAGRGLITRIPLALEHLWFDGFRDTNLEFNSNAPGGGFPGNVSLCYAAHISTSFSGGHGIFVEGGNSQILSFLNIDSKSNDKCGIFDSGFNGNTWMNTHCASNGAKSQVTHLGNHYYTLQDDPVPGATEPGTDPTVWRLIGPGVASSYIPEWVGGNKYWIGSSYRADSANGASVFTMAYAEGGQPPAYIKFPNIMIGGLHPNFTAETDGIIIGGQVIDTMPNLVASFSRAKFPSPVAADNGFTVAFGYAVSTPDAAMELLATGDDSHGLAPFVWDDTTKTWMTQHNVQVARIPVRYTTKNSTITAGRSAAVGPGNVMYPQGLFFGGSPTTSSLTNQRHLGGGTSTPASGEVAQGDWWVNTSAASGGKPGDVCTTGGTAGSTAVYKAMANLA